MTLIVAMITLIELYDFVLQYNAMQRYENRYRDDSIINNKNKASKEIVLKTPCFTNIFYQMFFFGKNVMKFQRNVRNFQ